MAYIVLSVAFGKHVGIGVDTHVHRLCNRLGWTAPAGAPQVKTPEQTRVAIESWLPKALWSEINLLFVGMGQELQVDKELVLYKCLASSRPSDALTLVQRLGMDVAKEVGKLSGLSVNELPPYDLEPYVPPAAPTPAKKAKKSAKTAAAAAEE